MVTVTSFYSKSRDKANFGVIFTSIIIIEEKKEEIQTKTLLDIKIVSE